MRRAKQIPIVPVAGVIAVVVLLAFAAYGLQQARSSATTSAAAGYASTTVSGGTAAAQQVKLSNSQYAGFSYLVSSAQLSQSAKMSISGFNLTRGVLANGSIRISFYNFGSSAVSSTFIICSLCGLYYLDSSFGDDSAPSGEYSFGDDGVIETDANGYIISPQ